MATRSAALREAKLRTPVPHGNALKVRLGRSTSRERAAGLRRHLGTYSLVSKNPGNNEARHKKDATPVVVCS